MGCDSMDFALACATYKLYPHSFPSGMDWRGASSLQLEDRYDLRKNVFHRD